VCRAEGLGVKGRVSLECSAFHQGLRIVRG